MCNVPGVGVDIRIAEVVRKNHKSLYKYVEADMIDFLIIITAHCRGSISNQNVPNKEFIHGLQLRSGMQVDILTLVNMKILIGLFCQH